MAAKKSVCILGSGNWGSAVAKIVGENVKRYPEQFQQEVRMWVFEEMVDGRKLTDIINEDRENVKYLAGHKLPENVRACPDIVEASKGADVLVFVIPHQFIERSCRPLVGKLKDGVQGISLIKGFAIVPTGGIKLMSAVIKDLLGMEVSVLMGANIASEVASGNFCETTIGCTDPSTGSTLKSMFETPNFRVNVVSDVNTVEICGALKNVVACGAGFVDGLKFGDNTKAAVIRIGLMEIMKYCVEHHKNNDTPPLNHDVPKLYTFFESCGIADLITTCYGGRNRRVAEAFVTSNKTLEQLEKEMLGGQKLQGPETAAEVNFILKKLNLEDQFPLFTSVHKICLGQMKPEELMEQLSNHPLHQQRTEDYTALK